MEPIPDIAWVTKKQRQGSWETSGKNNVSGKKDNNKNDSNRKKKQKDNNKMTPNEMASIFGHQENSNQNELRFFLTPFRMAKMKTTNNSYVGEDVKQGEKSSIAVTVQTYTTT